MERTRQNNCRIFSGRGSAVFLFNRKLRSPLNKTLRGMRTRAKWKHVAKATALGARVPQAELFVLEKNMRLDVHLNWNKRAEGYKKDIILEYY